MVIGNYQVKRILIDDGNVVEILSYSAFQKMGLKDDVLRLVMTIYRFSNQLIRVKDIVSLLVTLGQGENIVTVMADFLVVDRPSK